MLALALALALRLQALALALKLQALALALCLQALLTSLRATSLSRLAINFTKFVQHVFRWHEHTL